MTRPKRKELRGFSLSELKTQLKLLGHKVPRNMSSNGYVTEYNNRMYRWRWWDTAGFYIDISEPLEDFDRWANSTKKTIDFSSFHKNYKAVN